MLGEGEDSAPGEDYVLVDSGASRSTCPSSHAPTVPLQAASEALDVWTADDRAVAHYGEKTVIYTVPEAEGMDHIGIQWQVADVAHPTLGVAEAVGHGHSVLISPAGSFVAPVALTLPAGTPNVPLRRHQYLFWMRSRPTTSSASSGLSTPLPIDTILEGAYRQESAAGASAADGNEDEDSPATAAGEQPQREGVPVG